ncbi:transglutaminase-like cysteine peptidase [Uliginosibacterium gangwonense]|uniref:transglutaminase-like cysteine peptidase n=1 Tax=Uliginosibacterium gangwonense TaxID=392736 RepID=UPI00036DE528|nr:transglutaminase-like cysteine peptidase [Uliginosibacterium gangwonense]
MTFALRKILRLSQLAMVMAILGTALSWGSVDIDRMRQYITTHYGYQGVRNYKDWRALLVELEMSSESDKLVKINDFFNRRMEYAEDIVVWRQDDYWATPLEFLGKGAGDCEDYVIAKYFSLIEVGVDRRKLRWIYVMASIGNTPPQAHMVLGYYSSPNAEPYILDILNPNILLASRRPDLVAVFSFNSDGIWKTTSIEKTGTVSQLSRWQDLMRKMKEEGYEP